MDHHTSFHGTSDPSMMLATYSVCLDRHEARILRPLESKLIVNLSKMTAPLDLFSSSKAKLPAGTPLGLVFSLIGNPNSSDASQPKWELGSIFQYTTFNVADLRSVFVFTKNIANEVENAYILNAPMTPQPGFHRTWSTFIDMPNGFMDAGFHQRAIHMHTRTKHDGE
jgi:hypothetical protein